MPSSESEDEGFHTNGKKTDFSEMLKNKMQQIHFPAAQSASKKIKQEFEFNPPASSTQIGTPNELKHRSRKPVNKISKQPRTLPKMQFKAHESSSEDSESDSSCSDDNSAIKSSQQIKTISSTENTPRVQRTQRVSSDSEIDISDSELKDQRSLQGKKISPVKLQPKKKIKPINDSTQIMQVKSSDSESESSDGEKMIKNTSAKLHIKKERSSSSDGDSNQNKPKRKLKSSKKRSVNESLSDSASASNSEIETVKPTPTIRVKENEVLSDESSSNEFVTKRKKKVDIPRSKSPSSRLKSLEAQESLRRLRVSNDTFGNIKSKEQIYLMQIPIKLDPSLLIGTSISLTESMRIPQNKKYDSIPTLEVQEPLTILSSSEDEPIRLVKPVGYIKIQRHLKEKHTSHVPEVIKYPVAFPDNLKERHPLFGADFDCKINLEEHVHQKLKAAIETLGKKKKKKDSKKREVESVQQEEEIFKFLNEPSTSVKSIDEVDDGMSKKKRKKKKKNRDDSSEDVDETPDKLKESAGKKRKHEDGGFEKKKKKKKHRGDSPTQDSLIQEMLLSQTALIHKKKKKKKTHD